MSQSFGDPSSPVTLTVSQLNRQARSLLEGHFDYIWVEGEISNFAAPASGHWYFSLKDGKAQVRTAMFRNRNHRVRINPANGDHVRLRCRVSLYEGRGEFQLIAEHLEPAGAGALQAAFDKLKAKLLAQGLFATDRKQALPLSPAHIAVITSPTGAAIHDILTVLRRRSPTTRISLLPVAVQGAAAVQEICQAISRANRWHQNGLDLDVLLVGRGGGSAEDLQAFNDEAVARAIAASELPVVSAVGHEVDFSIADLVADQRAATPSAAAELLSSDQRQWLRQLAINEQSLLRHLRRQLQQCSADLGHLGRRLKHPGQQLREQAQRLDDIEQRLLLASQHLHRQQKSRLQLLQQRLHGRSPGLQLAQYLRDCETLQSRLQRATVQRLRQSGNNLGQLAQLLDSVSPLRTLERGYAIVSDEEGAVVTAAESQQVGAKVTARLASGALKLTIEEVLATD